MVRFGDRISVHVPSASFASTTQRFKARLFDWESTDTLILRPAMKIFSEILPVEIWHIEKSKKLKKQIIQRLDDTIPKMEYLTKT